MRFAVEFEENSLIDNSHIVYRSDEYSLDTVPVPTSDGRSVLVNDLSLELSNDGYVVAVWGLCPRASWKEISLLAVNSVPGRVRLIGQETIARGASHSLDSKAWPVVYDPSSRWLNIGQRSAGMIIAVTSNFLMMLNQGGELVGIRLNIVIE
jgi:hypothetical protein